MLIIFAIPRTTYAAQKHSIPLWRFTGTLIDPHKKKKKKR